MYKETRDPKLPPEEVRVLLLSASNWSQQKEKLPEVYRLAFQQAAFRAENPEWLPPQRGNSEKIIGHALKENRMEAGLLGMWDSRNALKGIGLLLLSPLWADVAGKVAHGHQIDDVIVDKKMRGRNIGQYAISYAASLAQSRGGSIVGWECEDDNTAQMVFSLMGAERRKERPLRINFKQVCRLLAEERPASSLESRLVTVEKLRPLPNATDVGAGAARDLISGRYVCKLIENNRVAASCLISQRVSVLRLLGYKPDGIHEEEPTGYQIESIKVNREGFRERAECAVRLVEEAIVELSALDNGCDFVDVVGDPVDPLVHEVAARFDIDMASGRSLWALQGGAFEDAAKIGNKLTKVIRWNELRF